MKEEDIKYNIGLDKDEDDPHAFYIPPLPIAGWYRVGNETTYVTKFPIYKKPNFIHRFFMRVMLGWYWEEKKMGE